jgi:F-type H+-transporting ATPase subunit delta
MRAVTVARNYAEALFELGERSGQADAFAGLIDAVAGAIETSPDVQAALVSPRIPKRAKVKLLTDALRGTPREFVLFVAAVVQRGRQALLREIASEYLALLDVKHNRVRASVTLAREPDERLRESIRRQLGEKLAKDVVATYQVDPEILGGAIVRVGETVHDGSVRRRLVRLRRQLVGR